MLILPASPGRYGGLRAANSYGRVDRSRLPSGYFLYSDFSGQAIQEQYSERAITVTGTAPFGSSLGGVGINWAAGGATSRANYATFAIPAQFTMEALVQIGTVQNENILSFVNNGGSDSSTFERQIAFRSTGVFHFYVFTGGINIITGTATAVAGDIVHVAATYDGTTYRLYVNGALDASSALGAAFGGYTNPSLTAGYQNVATGGGGSTTNQSTHTLLLAAMADRALDASEIWRRAERPRGSAARLFFTFGAGSAGVTVSLTGIASTFSAGTLIANHDSPLTGAAITGSAGTVVPQHTSAISGSAGTLSAGTVAPASSLALSGSAATASAGTLTAARSLALTGQAITSAAGTLAIGLSLAISGQAITSGIGTVSIGSDVAVALTGLAITSATGTVTPGLSVAIAGSAMTLSAGSLAYSARFTLAGISTASASGSVGISGGGSTVDAALTGLSMTVSPGNVRVTGGTKWVPQAARAVAIATAVGNTLPPPPRLTGDAKTDIQAQGQWLATLYDQLVKVNNVFGRINDHETRIATLEASNDNTH